MTDELLWRFASHFGHILKRTHDKIMHLRVLNRVGRSDKRLKQGVKVFIVLHIVNEADLHYHLFYLSFI